MSATELETRIRASLQDWANEIEDDLDDAPAGFVPDGPAPIRLVTLDPPTEPPTAPRDGSTSARWSPIRTLVLAGAAAVLVLVVAVAIIRSPGADVQAVDGPSPAVPEQAPGPRAIARVLPDGYGPIWRGETAPQTAGVVIGGGANTIQRFDTAGGSVTVLIRPGIGAAAQANPSANATVHEQPATVGSASSLSRVTWNELGAMVEAVGDGPDEATTLALLDSLVLRSDDPADGFDLPAGAAPGATLRAEQLWPRGSTTPTTSTVAYAATSSYRWSVVVSSMAAAGGADLDLVTSEVGSDRQVIAGKERVVVTPERQMEQVISSPAPGPNLADFFHVVAWYDTDGALIVVRVRDVDPQTLEAVVASIDRADDATWAALTTRISEQVESLPVATTSTWGDIELTMRGEAPAADNVIYGWQPSGACLRPGDGTTLCAADPYGGFGGGPMLLASTGWVPMGSFEGGQHLVTVATPEGWWLFGAMEGAPDEVVVTAAGDEVTDQRTATIDGRVTVIAALLPRSAPDATVTVSSVSTPVGTEVPATGVPQRSVRDITVEAPAP